MKMALFSFVLFGFLLFVILWMRRRGSFAYRPGAGPYYFAEGFLVLNYRIPEAHPLDRIVRVEFSLQSADNTCGHLLVHVLLRNGRKYSYSFRNAPPDFGRRFWSDLEAAGVECLRL